MEKLQVEKYAANAEDHKEVNRIFSQGIHEHVKFGIQVGLRNHKIQAFLALAFCIGYFNSWFHAVSYLMLALAIQSLSVFACYYTYVWEKLASDMKDKELKFWTTKPNAFLVAKINGKVVGCISYKQINQDTVEMNRLAVDSNHRGLRIGRKLVEALNDTAKNEGYNTMYLETSDAQVDALKMYEKMGFSFLRRMDFGHGYGAFFVNHFSGLCVFAYIQRL